MSIKLTDVTITQRRWQIDIVGKDEQGNDVHYVASADRAWADSGIFFGTAEDLKEMTEELW